ncbi:sacsin N-terminal ATP-binding-like domain-containing protein [Actinomadura sediminis]|uniref:Sacsin N-terminal ATP-binding-like domain-containing protein n=1 Tax=Actinomadura sediminis TaxID=1038904 RepID=A0ABW3ERB0_9ACTN
MTRPTDPAADPFGARALRERVLRAWDESPARFREDANTEDDHALGGYRDRVIVELAQNAADAASRAGVPGRLRLVLDDGVLTAANTGAPLDAPGVEALSTLRASAKRDDTGAVGRFGVGFAAVVAVTDSPAIASRTGAVAWCRDRARELAEGLPGVAAEVGRRAGRAPLLRLPFALPPADAPPIPDGFDTVVRLPLRDGDAVASVRAQLAEVAAPLLLALPALESVEIVLDGAERTLTARRAARPAEPDAADGRVPGAGRPAEGAAEGEAPGLAPGGGDRRPAEGAGPGFTPGDAADRREPGVPAFVPDEFADGTAGAGASVRGVVIDGVEWATVEAHGAVPDGLLADRPVEERDRPFWLVRWALPEGGDVPRALHAPTPTDEPLDLPALLIASFPLAPDRRHVAPGPLTDFLVERAADAYVRLMGARAASPAVLGLVPGPVAAGELDARLRRAIADRLPEAPVLPGGTRGRDALVLDAPAGFVELLGGHGDGPAVFGGLLPPGWPARSPALAALGARRIELADVVDELAAVEREPAWWRGVYAALEGADAEGLGALPVPLADDRLVRGPRGLLIADGVDPAGLGVLGLRFVHPDAVHPLLRRLGAVEAGPRAVLGDPAVRAAVEDSFDADDPDAVAEAVLGLVAAGPVDPGDEPWLAELALPGDDGELYPAGELLLPGSPLRGLMADDAPFGVVDGGLLERWGAETLAAAGVLDGFALARAEDVDLTALADEAETLHLDGEELWADDVLRRVGPQELPPAVPELTAVRDLELVDDWAAALRLLAEPPWRAAIVEPAHVVLHTGRRAAVPSYTAWWLGRRPVLEGRAPGEFRLPGDDSLAGLYDVAPDALDERLLTALGVRTSLDDLLDEPGGARELLERLADPARDVARDRLGALWTALADAPDLDVAPPERVRAVVDGEAEVVDAADALVLDRPDLLPLLAGQPLVIAARGREERLAELLDLPLASDEVAGEVSAGRGGGAERPVPEAVRAVLPDAPDVYRAHDRLIVDGTDVQWWVGDGHVHADGPAGLARALAWVTGEWEARLRAEAVLRDFEALPVLRAEGDLDD